MEDIIWLGHASFFFEDKKGNKIYFVAPFELGGRKLEKADLIFITHAHYAHFSPKDIAKIIKDDTVLIAPSDILSRISIPADRKVEVKPNQSYEVKGFRFSTVPAYNIKPERLNFHPKANNWVGYIFELNDKKVYHAGDTDFIPEMNNLKSLNLDVALLPMGGTYTMDAQEAAQAANAIGAKITIPMHYKMIVGNKASEVEEKFKSLVTTSKVLILTEFS